MLSKRDKLLIRPWQQRRYENHRRKVQSALPAIDNRPPPSREHITYKLKKQQKESERIAKIERDNLKLLQKLCYIMKTNRVDNYWNTPPPSFLSRVFMYRQQPKPDFDERKDIVVEKISHIRKNKCSACTPKKSLDSYIPEERIPWEPERPAVSKRRSQSVPPKKLTPPPADTAKKSPEKPTNKPALNERSKSCKSTTRKFHTKNTTEDRRIMTEDRRNMREDGRNMREDGRNVKEDGRNMSEGRRNMTEDGRNLTEEQSPNAFILTKGTLTLSVNFPSDGTQARIRQGLSERLLVQSECYCKALSSTKVV